MARKQNPLDRFREEVCSCCDLPNAPCEPGSLEEIACLLAAVREAVREK